MESLKKIDQNNLKRHLPLTDLKTLVFFCFALHRRNILKQKWVFHATLSGGK
jgi:hypothetical protein